MALGKARAPEGSSRHTRCIDELIMGNQGKSGFCLQKSHGEVRGECGILLILQGLETDRLFLLGQMISRGTNQNMQIQLRKRLGTPPEGAKAFSGCLLAGDSYPGTNLSRAFVTPDLDSLPSHASSCFPDAALQLLPLRRELGFPGSPCTWAGPVTCLGLQNMVEVSAVIPSTGGQED